MWLVVLFLTTRTALAMTTSVVTSRKCSGTKVRREVVTIVLSSMVALPACAAQEPRNVGRGIRAVGTPNAGADIDAALGIPWGGKKRCDAADAECGADGASVDQRAPPPPEVVGGRATSVAEIVVSVAGKEEGTIRIGLFEDASPESSSVFAGMMRGDFETEGTTEPAGYADGGCDLTIRDPYVIMAAPREQQEIALRRKFGLRKTPDDFVPAAPARGRFSDSSSSLRANAPGLLLTKATGPGERIEFALQTSRRRKNDDEFVVVVGAIMDDESMRLLTRLANVPVVAQRAALGGKAGKPIVKVGFPRTDVVPI